MNERTLFLFFCFLQLPIFSRHPKTQQQQRRTTFQDCPFPGFDPARHRVPPYPPGPPPGPLGGIEKVVEYRPVPNGKGAVGLRRVTPSAAGPVEHIQARKTRSDDGWRDSKERK